MDIALILVYLGSLFNYFLYIFQAVRTSMYGRPGPSYIEIPGNMVTEEINSNKIMWVQLHSHRHIHLDLYVGVLCRNWRLFHHIFRSHRWVQGAISLSFRQRQGSYAPHRLIRYSCIYEACISPTLNGSLAIWQFKHSNAIKTNDKITFNFYTGLPHMWKMVPYQV